MWVLLYELICYNCTENITDEQKDLLNKLSPGFSVDLILRFLRNFFVFFFI